MRSTTPGMRSAATTSCTFACGQPGGRTCRRRTERPARNDDRRARLTEPMSRAEGRRIVVDMLEEVVCDERCVAPLRTTRRSVDVHVAHLDPGLASKPSLLS